MWEKKLLVKIPGVWEEHWKGATLQNSDLQVVSDDKTVKLISSGYTQSKRVEKDTQSEGYWNWQVEAVDLSSIKTPRILILGFGGGTVGTLIKKKYLQATIDGIEIDPRMIELGKNYLDLKVEDFNIIIENAFAYLKKTKEKYDAVVVDLFTGVKTPPEIDSEDFYQNIKKLLKEKGQVSVNRIYERGSRWERLDLFSTGEKEYKRFSKLFSNMFKNTRVIEVPSHFFSKNYIFVGEV